MLRGKLVFEWSLEMLLAAGCSPILVAVPDSVEIHPEGLPPGEVVFVTGGATRQASVRNALEQVRSDVVVVHDAARPLARPELVQAVLSALGDSDGAITALPVEETVKRVEGDEMPRVVETVERSSLWRTQTPGAFRTKVLMDAHERALQEGFVGTDEAQLIERYGGRIVAVRGARDNIKVTFPEDLTFADAWLTAR